ncbi:MULTISPECIES: amino acid ABC transporter permease [Pseudomonas]|jgi:polar amino acid transport system permease protein|uniref:amino acid ABC transporter permease n=1 Tax=Pseudomonas TaxID=286 RepID=UPI000BA3A9DA|nr:MULTISPECIES: amino acid ABC transporter permease [Pseudomonas]MCT4497864.1 amino acid ABC transporter permease [Pseudomonas sivasensis]
MLPEPSPLMLLWQWAPALLQGFGLNILMGVTAMLVATVLGVLLGSLQVSARPALRRGAGHLSRLLRNLPWLVVMFYVAYLLPYEVQWAGRWWQLPDWLKVALGLALPAIGYVSEIVRGGVYAVPSGQWEAAQALGLRHGQALRYVIIPQTLPSLVAPWMNLYCAVTMSTSLANLLGVEELMTTLQSHLSSQLRSDLLLPAYGVVFIAFFLYIYPLSRWAKRLERR